MEIRRRARVSSRGKQEGGKGEEEKRGKETRRESAERSASRVSNPLPSSPTSLNHSPHGVRIIWHTPASRGTPLKRAVCLTFLKVFSFSLSFARSLARSTPFSRSTPWAYLFRFEFFSLDHSERRSRPRSFSVGVERRSAWREIGVSAGGRNKVKEVDVENVDIEKEWPSSRLFFSFFRQTRWGGGGLGS